MKRSRITSYLIQIHLFDLATLYAVFFVPVLAYFFKYYIL